MGIVMTHEPFYIFCFTTSVGQEKIRRVTLGLGAGSMLTSMELP
jgi:hypothetical protein